MITPRPHRFVRCLTGALVLATSLGGVCLQARADAPAARSFYNSLTLQKTAYHSVWERLRSGMTLAHDTSNPRVRAWIEWYQAHPRHLEHTVEQARPWLRFVTLQVENRNIPAEIALLPFIESAYNPTARHPYSGATGMWQFMPVTGDEMGLDRTWWYDGRKDVVSATSAALGYLDKQRTRWYDGDWLLALAAYNAGAGTVNRAQALAAARSRPTDYWHLHLPAETMDYVPKLLALSAIIAHPARYGMSINTIPDKKTFAEVRTHGQLDLELAARLAGTSLEEIRALNPGYRRWATRPANNGPLLIPVHRKAAFEQALASLPASERDTWQRYTVKPGDALSVIARRYNAPLHIIKARNNLTSSRLRAGQTLLVPGHVDQMLASAAPTTPQARVIVSRGDTLSSIASQHGLTTRQLATINNLSTADVLHPGQTLSLR
ncbi:LysM peptidoglycan-binding domain-containing protein [Larsenimonas rhizosphaerae]|uniref:LysM peptidoglycan-binding domain-containing protein n=1 Tax=Larsenimonas rhizosphaerae TaxID=2944682 RepID=A0AA41ZG36_9GAMM|nr:LysM peptidoglycan-binding domain-containing protein [Larsenimonas rhizosphaerae]MCM2130825.1 LysM peptidoglycan-binding domain-containing protein [Larsenimonas rhizosphaerae]MCX2523529.1 LysM peptidoglycan-binding domain-containing protein [Larsenimonas rhizosphaerae]